MSTEQEKKTGVGTSSWASKGAIIGGLVVAAGVGIVIGRWTRSVPEVEAKPSAAATGSSSAPASASSTAAPMQFDLQENPRFTAGVPLREMDKAIFEALKDPKLDRQRVLDVFPDKPYRVRFIGSVHDHTFGVVLVDANRDNKFEERWELKASGVTRTVMEDPNNGDAPVRYTLAHGRWQVH